MRVFISADMEGITGIAHGDQLMPGKHGYEAGRTLMTDDVNAAIAGVLLHDPDATFVVCDGHAVMRNLQLERLHEAAELVIGPASWANKPLCQSQGIDDRFDLALFVGYHSKSGTTPGLLAHTWVGSTICNLSLNGQVVGETALNAAVVGAFGVPVGLVTSKSAPRVPWRLIVNE